MPRKVFVAGEILTAADVNANLMDQAVMVFDDAAARTTAIPSPVEGMVTYLKDTDKLEKYTTDWVDAAPGKILQVLSTTKTDTFTASAIASGATTTVTGLEVTITPSATSSKIIVSVDVVGGVGTNPAIESPRAMGVIVKRAGTPISIGDASGSRSRTTFTFGARVDRATTGSATILDSPNTTSATTYSVDLLNEHDNSTDLFVNRSQLDSDAARIGRGASRITVMEVVG